MNRRGTLLLEAVIAAGLSALLIVSALGSLSLLQGSTGRVASRASSHQALRGAAQLLRSELVDLSPRAGEIVSFSAGTITYRATRGSGIACGSTGGRIQVILTTWAPLRQPVAGRDALVLIGQPGDSEIVVSSFGPPGTGACPDGVASLSLPYVAITPDPSPGARYPSPVLVTETMEIRGYESGGEWWVGVRSVSAGEVIQPALGPIMPNGFRVIALDSAGTPTIVPALVSHLVFLVKSSLGDSTVVRLDLTSGAWR